MEGADLDLVALAGASPSQGLVHPEGAEPLLDSATGAVIDNWLDRRPSNIGTVT